MTILTILTILTISDTHASLNYIAGFYECFKINIFLDEKKHKQLCVFVYVLLTCVCVIFVFVC